MKNIGLQQTIPPSLLQTLKATLRNLGITRAGINKVLRPFRPSTYLYLLFYPLKRTLMFSPKLFWRFYKATEGSGSKIKSSDDRIESLTKECKRSSVVNWKSMYSQEEISELRETIYKHFERGCEELEKFPDANGGWYDPVTGGVFRRSNPLSSHGKTRLQFKDLSKLKEPLLKKIIEDPRLTEVCSSYFGVKCSLHRITIDHVVPAPVTHIDWHIDSFLDIFKSMLLLTDVTKDAAPMVVKKGSHNSDHPVVITRCHEFFKNGATFAYPPEEDVKQLKEQDSLGTGKAGDCLFFDPSSFHRGSQAAKKERLVVVFSYKIPTFRNMLFQIMGH